MSCNSDLYHLQNVNDSDQKGPKRKAEKELKKMHVLENDIKLTRTLRRRIPWTWTIFKATMVHFSNHTLKKTQLELS